MPTGLQVYGDGFYTQIDDTLGLNLKFVTKFTYNRVGTRFYIENRFNITVPSGLPTSDLVLAVRPEQNMGQAFRVVILPNKPNASTVTIQVIHPQTHDSREMRDVFYRVSFTGYIFVRSDVIPSPTNFGLEVYNELGQLAFSSSNKQVVVSRVIQTSNRPRGSFGDGWWTWRCQTGITDKTNRAYLMVGARSFLVPSGRYESIASEGTEGFGWNNNQLFVDFFTYTSTDGNLAVPTYLPNTGGMASLFPILIEFDVTGY